jgi:hypothetical protein
MSEALDLIINFLSRFIIKNEKDKEHATILTNCDKYKSLKKYLRLQTYDTNKLIQLYFQEMAHLQMSLKSTENGKLYCIAYYHSKNETLVVESKRIYYLFFKENLKKKLKINLFLHLVSTSFKV